MAQKPGEEKTEKSQPPFTLGNMKSVTALQRPENACTDAVRLCLPL